MTNLERINTIINPQGKHLCRICDDLSTKKCDNTNCSNCEWNNIENCINFLKQEYKSPIKMSKFEYDLLISYISIYKERDRIFCTRPLLQRMFVLGCFVNVHPQLTLNEILERAVIVDAK